MRRYRHTPEQIIRKLREADRLLAEARRSPRSASTWRSARRPPNPALHAQLVEITRRFES